MNPDFGAYTRLSDQLARAGDWGPRAEAVNRKLVEAAPKWVVPYTRLAKCLRDRGDVDGALTFYRRALEIEPNNVIARNNVERMQRQRSGEDAVPAPAMQSGPRRPRPTPQPPTGPAEADGLSFLHQRLTAHFAHLHEQRAAYGADTPVFALEHGLADSELALLKSEVQAAVRRGHTSSSAWLPYVVYATEIGYSFTGEEYWLTFEAETPGWRERGDRYYVQDRFLAFHRTFGGARPTGAWAEHFSIISWPITHSVLPTDLQVHLARLLYDYRGIYTSDLLANPSALGKRLAAWAWHTSSRFQNFAQNTELLGHVAAAMLLATDEDSPYLLRATLQRIVRDLERERQAKRWLQHARRRAGEVRLTGLRKLSQTEMHPPAPPRATPIRLPSSTDPLLLIGIERGSCVACFEVPDLSPLAERLPTLHQEVANLRPTVSGYAGSPLPRAQLLYPGRRLRFASWPPPGNPLIQLEDGSPAANSLLADQCALSPGPPWLFKFPEASLAAEIRGKRVRPAERFVLLTIAPLSTATPSWIAPLPCATQGVSAYTVDVPPIVTSADIAAVRSVGLAMATDIAFRPTGIVPALWDGEGLAEWLTDDNPLIAVSSNHSITRAFMTLDGESFPVDWPSDQSTIYLRLDPLDIGTHELRCSLFPSEHDGPLIDGVLDVVIRPPRLRPSTGGYREGLMILPTVVSPTLSELWYGRAALDIRGPLDADVTIEMLLMDRAHRVLGHHTVSSTLPITASQWQTIASSFRQTKSLQRTYESAEICTIITSHPRIGIVSLTCERDFVPLRWATGSDRDGSFVRLIDNTDLGTVEVDIREYDRPDTPVQLYPDADGCIRRATGGLLQARTSTVSTSVILAPRVKAFTDLHEMDRRPWLHPGPRTPAELLRLIALAETWEAASLPPNLFAEQQRTRVLRTITAHIASLIGGGVWHRAELEYETKPKDWERTLADSVGATPVAADVSAHAPGLRHASLARRVQFLAGALASRRRALGVYAMPFRAAGLQPPETRLADFLLRLASSPGSLLTWNRAELHAGLTTVLSFPVLLRAARFLVLATAEPSTARTGTYEGWVWES